jgi:phage replication initiation protein
MFGYESGIRFFMDVNGTACAVGRVDYGGLHHKGRARLDLSGSCCQLVKDWLALQTWVGQQPAVKITRVDLAVDCLMGEFTVETARDWYLAGEFRAGTSGAMPRHSTPGDWLTPETVYGRTLEVGRRENGKMCRVYEKGRQLGDAASSWTRFEVEWRNNDRDLPLDVLTDCDKYFAGAYKCLQLLLDAMPERIATHQKEGEIVLEKLTVHASTSYGKLIDVLRLKLTASEVLDVLSRPGIPGRLEKSSLAAFNLAASPSAYFKEKRYEQTQCDRF